MDRAEAMFGAGCFWHVEASFKKLHGVVTTSVGYSGGQISNPTYKQVCTGRTGHAEVVYIQYDPEQISYDDLLTLFWSIHDPTTPNRQGPDVGEQYRSIVFYFDLEQKRLATASLQREAERLRRPVVTQIIPATPFYRAEEYHQCYLQKKKGED